jgi:hypothetical protein
MYLLCAYADGPYWASCLDPLAYPTGCSYYRPFSYREKYLSPSLLKKFEDDKKRERFLTDDVLNRGVFGIRFRPESGQSFYEKFIPLRLVTLTDINILDTVQINFRLGEYIKLSPEGKLRTISLGEVIDSSKPETTILIEPPAKSNLLKSLEELFDANNHQPESPNRLWERFVDDESLSPVAKQQFANATVLRLLEVRERGTRTPLTPKHLKKESVFDEIAERERHYPRVFGFELVSGAVYDLKLAYNRIVAAGASEQHVNYAFVFSSPTEHFDISKGKLPITGKGLE